jgi:short-subunit dehydrogenase
MSLWGQTPLKSMNNTAVMITGASRGIGLALARRCREAGARVALLARDAERLRQVANELGGVAISVDLSRLDDLPGLYARCERELGQPIDFLVNNAANDATRYLSETSLEELTLTHNVNLIAPMELCRQALSSMRTRGGHILNVSSLAACGGFSGMSSYCASKAGLVNFTGILREEYRGAPVRFTTVWLGPVSTDMIERARSVPRTRESFALFDRLHLMRDASTEEVAEKIVQAMRDGRSHVLVPKRGAIYAVLNEAPRWIASQFLRLLPEDTNTHST